jgi:glutaredoxin-dependent peroxiredoxin
MALPVGSSAPDFTLKSMGPNGLEDIKLSNNFDVQATVVLFFPLAFTGVCTKELCDVTAGLSNYSSLNADVIAISVDSPFAQEAWAKKESITIKLASDLNKETTKAYDVLFPNLADIGDTAARAAFVIGKDGVIYYSEQTPTPKDLPDFNKIEQILKTLSL